MKGNGFEYVGTYSKSKKKATSADENKFTVKEKSLEVKTFQQDTDSGYYSCVYLNNNELKFGTTFKLRGEKGGLLTSAQLHNVHTPFIHHIGQLGLGLVSYMYIYQIPKHIQR